MADPAKVIGDLVMTQIRDREALAALQERVTALEAENAALKAVAGTAAPEGANDAQA